MLAFIIVLQFHSYFQINSQCKHKRGQNFNSELNSFFFTENSVNCFMQVNNLVLSKKKVYFLSNFYFTVVEFSSVKSSFMQLFTHLLNKLKSLC